MIQAVTCPTNHPCLLPIQNQTHYILHSQSTYYKEKIMQSCNLLHISFCISSLQKLSQNIVRFICSIAEPNSFSWSLTCLCYSLFFYFCCQVNDNALHTSLVDQGPLYYHYTNDPFVLLKSEISIPANVIQMKHLPACLLDNVESHNVP